MIHIGAHRRCGVTVAVNILLAEEACQRITADPKPTSKVFLVIMFQIMWRHRDAKTWMRNRHALMRNPRSRNLLLSEESKTNGRP